MTDGKEGQVDWGQLPRATCAQLPPCCPPLPLLPLFPTQTPPGQAPGHRAMAPPAGTELHNKRWEALSVDDKFIVGLLQRAAADITARFTTDIRFTGSSGGLSLSL